jgi:rhodanese-related sulfurtransferase
MKPIALTLLAALLAAPSLCSAYGISPSRAQQGGILPSNNGQFQMQPAPQPSNNLMNPGGPPLPGQPAPMGLQPTIDPTKQIEDAIKNYKPADWAKAWGHIGLPEAKRLHENPNVLFVDARAKVEYDQGHIPGAIPLPPGDIKEFDKYYALYKSKILQASKIVTYCHGTGCQLSDKCAKQLVEVKHLKNVVSFFGGWPQWQDDKMPVETGPVPGKR